MFFGVITIVALKLHLLPPSHMFFGAISLVVSLDIHFPLCHVLCHRRTVVVSHDIHFSFNIFSVAEPKAEEEVTDVQKRDGGVAFSIGISHSKEEDKRKQEEGISNGCRHVMA